MFTSDCYLRNYNIIDLYFNNGPLTVRWVVGSIPHGVFGIVKLDVSEFEVTPLCYVYQWLLFKEL